MRCGHCGMEYPDESEYCPHCAEPKPKPEPTVDEQYVAKQSGRGVLLGIVTTILMQIIFLIFTIMGMGLVGIFMIFFLCPGFIPLCWYGMRKEAIKTVRKNDRNSLILKQFTVDQTSICPSCGCHSISLGRKGYDWNKGFWYSIFNVPGGRYLAGMDGRKITCYCNNCNHRWESDRVWIK